MKMGIYYYTFFFRLESFLWRTRELDVIGAVFQLVHFLRYTRQHICKKEMKFKNEFFRNAKLIFMQLQFLRVYSIFRFGPELPESVRHTIRSEISIHRALTASLHVARVWLRKKGIREKFRVSLKKNRFLYLLEKWLTRLKIWLRLLRLSIRQKWRFSFFSLLDEI